MPLQVALFEPEIPPNTGNILRLAANSGILVHLVEPLGFELDDARLKRAGMDYRERAAFRTHPNLDAMLADVQPQRVWALTTKGQQAHSDVQYHSDDLLLFGPETRGLPDSVLSAIGPESCLRIPMLPDSRSLNLSNAVAIVVYEAWRQLGFDGARS